MAVKTELKAKDVHQAEMDTMLEDSLQLKDKKTGKYLQINNNKFKDAILKQMENIKDMTGTINTALLADLDMIDLNLLSLYENDEVINYDVKEIGKGADYWEKATDDYIQVLKDRLEQDISNLSKREFSNLVRRNNNDYFTKYLFGIKMNSLDLADANARLTYATRMANNILDLQVKDILKIDLQEFLDTDLKEQPYKFSYFLSLDDLINIQQTIKETANKLKLDKESTYTKYKIVLSLLKQHIHLKEINKQVKGAERLYKDSKDFFDKRHKKRQEIEKLTKDITSKYKEQEEYYKTINTDFLNDTDILINEMQKQDKDIETASLNTSLLSNKLFAGIDMETGKPYDISYIEKTTHKEITTSITIYDANNDIIELNKEHRDINDAVGSLIDNGITILTTKQLYNFINKGILSNEYVDQKNIDALLNELYKMDRKAEIDATEQFHLRGYKKHLDEYEKFTGKKAKPILSQQLLNFKMLKNIPFKNGEEVDIIQFMDYPAIYNFAKQYRQLAPYPAEILNLNYSPKYSNNNTIKVNDITRTLRNELIRCIELRKSGINQPLVINNFLCDNCQFYDVIDKDIVDKNKIHTKILNKNKRIRYTKNIETILNNFKDKKYIKDYKINKKGNSTKYSITFEFFTAIK